MSRAGEGGRLKKHNCCLTCSIICFILTIVFFVALYVGGTIMFKTYVSPHIGGLELNDAIALAANVLSGQEAETTYAEEDLDSFYSGLSEAMFLSEKSEDELEYELVPEAKRATLAPAATAAAGEDDAAAYDEDAAYAAFLLLSKAGRYALLTDETKGKISLAEYSALAGSSDAAKASRDKVGLKTYRISLESLLSGMDFGAEDFSTEAALNKGLSSLDFNFDTLVNYNVDDPTAQANEKFTTFSVNGKQVSAFINDVLTFFLSGPNSPLTSMLKENLPIDVDLTQYFKISSVTIMNTPLVTKDGEALYDQKDTALGVSVSIKLRDLVATALETDELKKQLDGVPSFAVDLIPNLVPKHFSAHATVYPLAPAEDQREVTLTINKPSEKNSQRLSTLLNAILGNGSESASETFLGNINNQVSAAFSSVNEVVKINFVPSKDKEGNPLKDDAGNTYSEMKIMTWDTVLSLIDKEGRLSAHDVFTMLKCLYISTDRPSEISVDEAFADFKSDMSSKYGVSSTYLEEHNLLSTEDLGGIIENINLNTLDFTKTNEQMQVRLSAEALAAFMKGMVTGVAGELASAEEEGDGFDPSTMLQGLDPKVCGIEIKKLSDKDGAKIYSFELIFSADLAEMVRTQLPSDGIAGDLARKLLPKKSSYFGIKIYLSEYTEDGKVLHKVGKNIDGAEDGATSLYASKLRINDFSYEETDRAIASLSAFMEVLSGSEEGFSLSSVTDTIEDAITSIFDSLAESDFNMTLRLYESDGVNKGGVHLPSIYEMIAALVSLNGSEETFTTEDAREVLWLMYNKQVSMEETFTQGQVQTFLDEINDKFYITKDNALAAGDLFGDGASNLSEKIKPDAIYFKPTSTEAAKWTGEKKALYTDTRSAADLRASLTGSELAAIIDGSNLIPSDVASSFGGIKMLGASFKTTGGKTYLNFDIKLLLSELVSGEGDVSKYSNLFPANIKLTTKILLYATSYTEAEPQYHSEVIINEDESGKIFMLMRALGGADMGETAIAETLSEAISAIFTPLNENKVPLLYYQNAGAAYTSGDEECIKIVDVFTFLAGATEMTDISGDATDPDALAARLRGFGKQVKSDSNNEGNYEWMGDRLNLFLTTDDDYVYTNMQRAYFLNEAPSMDEVYNFSAKFETIGEDFNLKGENGLFYYDGDVKNLKVSDKALAVILKEKQASAFASAVSGEGMTVEIVSLKIYHENTKLVLESGVKIAFDGRDAYKMMPDYFFVIAKTVKDDIDPSGYVTTVSMNTLSAADTSEIFQNIASLAMNASSFGKTTIESKINEAISGALGMFPASVTFGEFTSSDVTNEYNKGTYGDTIRVAAGDGYISFPSVYSFLIDILYGAEESKPTEKELQHMLNSLHAGDTAVADALVTNPMSEDSYHKVAFKGTEPIDDAMPISSDRYLAYQINSRFSSVSIASGKLSLADALQQLIVLRGLGAEEEHDVRTYWEGKVTFADGSGYHKSHDVMIATAKLDLGSYGTGAKISLLPENLWLTVFADMTSTDDSEGLLYDMNAKDTEIFVHVLSKYNEGFSIKAISKQFAEAITEQLDDVASGLTVSYKLAGDDVYYYETPLAAADVANRKNVKEDDDPAMDGVGYVVIANTAV